MTVGKGIIALHGCTKIDNTYYFGFSSMEDSVDLLIFDKTGKELKKRVNLDSSFKTGDLFACSVKGEQLEDCLYCYETKDGQIADPYSKSLTNCEKFGEVDKEAKYLSRLTLEAFDWEGDKNPEIPYDEACFYKMHVRGFTKSHTSKVKHKGTFKGIIEKIPYIKELGVTTLELMPAYEFDELQRFPWLLNQTEKNIYTAGIVKTPLNYWGYSKGFLFAPKSSYCFENKNGNDYTKEIKEMVKQLHKENIEVVMEMLFADEPVEMALDCLKYWLCEYHIDGFHIYARDEIIKAAADSPELSKTKVITTFWDGNLKHFKNMGNSNGGFAVIARKFLKGDDNQLAAFVNAARSNPAQSANINYITEHDGFTLNDLVSYDRKHNESNGEDNRDGENFNYSWNCGFEGKTRRKRVVDLRQKQIKNAFMMLLLSQGTPLIMAGDEFENSQNGNNNPYCVDGEESWVNWNTNKSAVEINEFVKRLIAFRKEHQILHMPTELLAYDNLSCGYPDLSYHGSSAWYTAMENYDRHIGIMYCSRYAKKSEEELIYVAYNMHWEIHELALPKTESGCDWKVLFSSDDGAVSHITNNRMVEVGPRTITVLKGVVKKSKKKDR